MRFIFILFLALLLIPPVYAADSGKETDNPITAREVAEWEKRLEKRDRTYDFELIALAKSNADLFPSRVRSVRNLYAFTSHYEPFSDGLVDKMTEYAYTVQTSTDRMKVNKALQAYRDLVEKHIANIGVLNFAITMARVSAKFGDPTYYENARKAVYNGLASGYDGSTPQRAFNIVVRDEEIFLLIRMGYTVEKSEIFHVNNAYYNVYDVRDENGKFDQIFMNITKPVKVSYIKKYLARKEQTYTIPGME